MGLFKTSTFRQKSIARRNFQKLALRYFVHLKLKQKNSPLAYKLDLPITLKIYPVFRISLLKPYRGKTPIEQYQFGDSIDNAKNIIYPKIILDC